MFSFGRTIHNTLYDFINQYSKEKIDLQKLLQIYDQRWIEEWYQDKKQRDEYYQQGKKSLTCFHNDYIKRNPSILLINEKPALEQEFNLKIGEYTINGKIDRIDQLDDGVEIIDYKTGQAKEKLKDREKEQLLIYQIASEQVFGLKPKKLTYCYLDEGKELSFLGTDEDKEKQKEKIISLIQEIKDSNFDPNPGWHCQFCDFKNICQYAKK